MTTTTTITTDLHAASNATLRFPYSLAFGALGLGIVADLFFYGRIPGVSFPLFVLLCLTLLYLLARFEGRTSNHINRWLGFAAIGFACLTALRAEPTILVLNTLTTLALILLQVGLFRGVTLQSLPGGEYLIRVGVTAVDLCFRPLFPLFGALRRFLSRGERLRYAIPVARGLALAVPIVGVFTILLMMADKVFANVVLQLITLNLPFSLDWLVGHALLTTTAAWVCAGALLVALRAQPNTSEGEHTYAAPWGLGCIEGLTVIVSIDLLFAGFMFVQAAYLFGGLDTLAQTQMTYADYARRGFFEIIAVATLTLGVIWLFVRATRRDANWQVLTFNAVAAILVFLTIGLLSSAFQRMWLYEQAYGFTHLRLYTHTFMIWLAIALLLCLAALIAKRPRWLSFGGFISALAVLAILTLANPEENIVRANIARYQANGDLSLLGSHQGASEEGDDAYQPSRALDTDYLSQLSPDATPALLELLPVLPKAEQEQIRVRLVVQQNWLEGVSQQGWPAWHWARARALRALQIW